MGPSKGTSAVSPETAAYIDLFKSIGLTQAKAAEAAKSAKSAALLQGLIERHSLTGRVDEKQAGLIAALAVQGTKIEEDERGYVVDAIIDGRLKSTDQVNGASPGHRQRLARAYLENATLHSGGQVPGSAYASSRCHPV
jgi:hypothetical protein